jgi:hypothetical protein
MWARHTSGSPDLRRRESVPRRLALSPSSSVASTLRGKPRVGARVAGRYRKLDAWLGSHPKTGMRRNLRTIAAELAALGHLAPSEQPYHPSSIRHMLATLTRVGVSRRR